MILFFDKKIDFDAKLPRGLRLEKYDANTYLIRDFQMTNRVTDLGLLDSALEEIKKTLTESQDGG